MPETRIADRRIVNELNDLLRHHHDAVQAYTRAIRSLENVGRRQTVIRFRDDHERHIADLTSLVRAHGGDPVARPRADNSDVSSPSGGDRAVLLGFRTNERRARDRFATAMDRLADAGEDIREAVRRAADDETRHTAWAEETLRGLGVTGDGPLDRASHAMESLRARGSDALDAVGRQSRRGYDKAREVVRRPGTGRALVAAVTAVGVGLAVVGIARGTHRRPRTALGRASVRLARRYG